MKEDNPVRDKSLQFATRVVKMVRFILKKVSIAEQPIFVQILKSGTSIGANVREAEYAESKDDFKHKLKIALKEANETSYWLELFHNCNYIDDKQYESINNDCKEVCKLLVAIINSLNNKNVKPIDN